MRAISDMIIVEPKPEKKIGVLYLPDGSKTQDQVEFGIVVSVGPDYPFAVKKGDTVIFRASEGVPLECDEKRIALKSKWVLAVMK